jgi:hypothetical protein
MTEALRKFGLLMALSLVVAISASGQGRGSGARGFSRSGRGLVAPGRSIGGTASRGFRPGFAVPPLVGSPLQPNFAPIRGVPGLAFDRQHPGATARPFRDRFGREHRGLFPFFPYYPLFFDSLPLDYSPYDTESPYNSAVPDYYTEGAQQPQFLIPQPLPQPQASVAALQTPAPPPPELGQLILVRRDGQVLLAVAFTVRNGQLTYITNEGARHTFPVGELDEVATREMNDANGTSVSLPD